jgi:hypothetical protein
MSMITHIFLSKGIQSGINDILTIDADSASVTIETSSSARLLEFLGAYMRPAALPWPVQPAPTGRVSIGSTKK